MTNYMPHRNDKIFHPTNHDLKVKLIKDFYNTVTEGMTDAGCRYFAHNLIKNREEPVMGSFSESPHNPMKYWEQYWDCNSQDYGDYTIRKKVGFQCLKPSQKDDDSSFGKTKKETTNKIKMCTMKDGFHFSIQHDNGILENFSFGWEKHDADQTSHQRIRNFSNKMDELNIGYFRLNTGMFETYPAVY